MDCGKGAGQALFCFAGALLKGGEVSVENGEVFERIGQFLGKVSAMELVLNKNA